jgi:hypothetical protein
MEGTDNKSEANLLNYFMLLSRYCRSVTFTKISLMKRARIAKQSMQI